MNVFQHLKRPFQLLSAAGDSLAAIADHLAEIAAAHSRQTAQPVHAGGKRFVTGKRCLQFVIEQSADRLWRRKIPLRDVLRWRTYREVAGGEIYLLMELVCAVLSV